MTINGNVALCRQLQVFFETELFGLFRWSEAQHEARELASPNGKRKKFGNYREIERIRFGNYDIYLASAVEHPPLGLIRLTSQADKIEGPLDSATWQQLGKFIRAQEQATV